MIYRDRGNSCLACQHEGSNMCEITQSRDEENKNKNAKRSFIHSYSLVYLEVEYTGFVW